jgi:hypothetical protein
MAKPKEKWCWYCRQYHPLEAFARNDRKPDGLQSECRAAQAERRGKIGRAVFRIGIGVAIAMALHSVFAALLGLFSGMSAAMPWNWFQESGIDMGDDWEVVPENPTPIDFPDDPLPEAPPEPDPNAKYRLPDPVEAPIVAEITEPYPDEALYRLPDREPDIAVGHGKDWTT